MVIMGYTNQPVKIEEDKYALIKQSEYSEGDYLMHNSKSLFLGPFC